MKIKADNTQKNIPLPSNIHYENNKYYLTDENNEILSTSRYLFILIFEQQKLKEKNNDIKYLPEIKKESRNLLSRYYRYKEKVNTHKFRQKIQAKQNRKLPKAIKHENNTYHLYHDGLRVTSSKNRQVILFIYKKLEKNNYNYDELPKFKKLAQKQYYHLKSIQDIPEIYKLIRVSHKNQYKIHRPGTYEYYGAYDTLEEAIERIKYLEKNDWDKSLMQRHKPENISRFNGKYRLIKRIDGQAKYYGTFDSYEEAVNVRDKYDKEGWPTIPTKTKTRRPFDKSMRYIHKVKDNPVKYQITKLVNGRFKYFGTFNSLEDAQEERDLLIEWGWTYDFVDLV